MLALGENEGQIELEIKKKLSSLETKLAEMNIIKLEAYRFKCDKKTLEIKVDKTMTVAQLAKAIGEVWWVKK